MGSNDRVVKPERVIERLPAGFDALRAEAPGEGYRFVERLATDWSSGTTRFDREGEALLAARVGGTLAGIGGLTIEPIVSGALRMRRFYVPRVCIGEAASAASWRQRCWNRPRSSFGR